MSDASESSEGLYAIVLAAGAATRFGSAKQLVRIKGRPLLHSVITRATEVVGDAVLVVLGARSAELAPLLRHSNGTIVINRSWSEGIASSIRAGVAKLPSACTGVMMVLADQAAVTAEDLKRLATTWRRQPEYIAAALYGSTVGVPAIFPRSRFTELSELRGDIGARRVIQRNPDRVIKVPMQSAALDLDTPEDLLALDPPQT